jgi:poly(A) polymerase
LNKPLSPREFAIEIVQKLRAAGFEAVWAGGCVRDALLGLEPKDYDVATTATPEQIRELFGNRQTLAIGAAFGVITVLKRHPAMQIEVATFRRDADYSDGRRPDSVTFSNMQQDAERRDITINGMFFDPIENRLIDFVGGRQDIQDRIVRAIGDPQKRISEDKLRMLRVVRFAATLDYKIEPATKEAVRQHAPEIRLVSAERITTEMRRMLIDPRRRIALSQLWSLHLLEQILPLRSDDLSDEQIATRLEQTLDFIDSLPVDLPTVMDSFAIVLSAILLPLCQDVQQAVQVCRDWKLANEEIDRVTFLLSRVNQVFLASETSWPQTQRLLIAEHGRLLIRFARAVAEQKLDARFSPLLESIDPGQSLAAVEFCEQRLAWPAEKLNPPPLIDGRDLKQIGFAPGPRFAEILTAVRDAQLMGRLVSKQNAIDWVSQQFGNS